MMWDNLYIIEDLIFINLTPVHVNLWLNSRSALFGNNLVGMVLRNKPVLNEISKAIQFPMVDVYLTVINIGICMRILTKYFLSQKMYHQTFQFLLPGLNNEKLRFRCWIWGICKQILIEYSSKTCNVRSFNSWYQDCAFLIDPRCTLWISAGHQV